mmetsp:Transcript_13161/g.47994  ORF Transcript_13161/g.47994 Transcript_13161/m.47994 type:complete len:613 (+) Transcript_13161:188-2026(+)|eukprot:scaffold1569_cov392-Prasinococcus_capsulatus_cf.AAC.3
MDALFVTQMGVLNSFRTGVVWLDVLVAAAIPTLIAALSRRWPEIVALYKTAMLKLFQRRNAYVREIVWEKFIDQPWRNAWSPNGQEQCETPPGSLLQQAIIMYISSERYKTVRDHFERAEYVLSRRMVSEAESGCHADEEEEVKQVSGGYDSEEDYDRREDVADTAARLQSYRVSTLPPYGVEVSLAGSLLFRRLKGENNEQEGEKSSHNRTALITFELTGTGRHGQRVVNDFVDRVWKQYLETLARDASSKYRYFYQRIPRKVTLTNDDNGTPESVTYNRYRLSDEKTFKSWFHPEKRSLLDLVDNFLYKKGKYGIEGVSHKLGLLLHGPPGTGKTSLIKALAQYTGRSIVSVPLARVKTNQELWDIMFDCTKSVTGEQMKVVLPYGKTIFILEDIDCASDVVLQRNGSASKKQARRKANGNGAGDEQISMAPQESLSEDVSEDDLLAALVQRQQHGPALPTGCSGRGADSGDEGDVSTTTKSVWSKLVKDPFEVDDKLNLSGLLNVLDGVIDCPGRIVVMTTNHIERLDPALIRPGRINKTLYMGYMGLHDVQDMFAHFFGEDSLTGDILASLEDVWQDGVLTPAAVEQMCLEHDSLSDLVDRLAVHFYG